MGSKEHVHREDGGHQHQADLHQDISAETPPAENEWKEIALRARAELSNYQKRAEKEQARAAEARERAEKQAALQREEAALAEIKRLKSLIEDHPGD